MAGMCHSPREPPLDGGGRWGFLCRLKRVFAPPSTASLIVGAWALGGKLTGAVRGRDPESPQ